MSLIPLLKTVNTAVGIVGGIVTGVKGILPVSKKSNIDTVIEHLNQASKILSKEEPVTIAGKEHLQSVKNKLNMAIAFAKLLK